MALHRSVSNILLKKRASNDGHLREADRQILEAALPNLSPDVSSDLQKILRDAVRHSNNFDAVRVIAAAAVLTGHMWPTHHRISPNGDISAFGVYMFFAISGYLVSASWDRDPDAARFLARRALRIFPGLACALLAAAFIVGPLVTVMPLEKYLVDPAVWQYVQSSIFLYPMQFQLPGVFVNNPLPYSVNDSLWTIPTEAALYVALAALGMTVWRVKALKMPVLALVCAAGIVLDIHRVDWVSFEVTRNITCFAYGALLWSLRDRVRLNPWLCLPMLTFLVVIRYTTGVYAFWLFLLAPYMAISFGAASTPVVRRVGRFGDFSYGFYIYAFLIQQTLMHAFPHLRFSAFFVSSAALSIGAGLASWHLIEKHAIKLKPTGKPEPQTFGGLNDVAY